MKEFLIQQLQPCNTWLCMPLTLRASEQWLGQCWTPFREGTRPISQDPSAHTTPDYKVFWSLKVYYWWGKKTKTQPTQTLQCLSQTLKPQGCPAGGNQPRCVQCPAGLAAHGAAGGPSSREALLVSWQGSSQADSKPVRLDFKIPSDLAVIPQCLLDHLGKK